MVQKVQANTPIAISPELIQLKWFNKMINIGFAWSKWNVINIEKVINKICFVEGRNKPSVQEDSVNVHILREFERALNVTFRFSSGCSNAKRAADCQ